MHKIPQRISNPLPIIKRLSTTSSIIQLNYMGFTGSILFKIVILGWWTSVLISQNPDNTSKTATHQWLQEANIETTQLLIWLWQLIYKDSHVRIPQMTCCIAVVRQQEKDENQLIYCILSMVDLLLYWNPFFFFQLRWHVWQVDEHLMMTNIMSFHKNQRTMSAGI